VQTCAAHLSKLTNKLQVNSSVALCNAKQLPDEAALAEYKARCKSLHTLSQVFDAFATVELNAEALLTRGGFLQALLCSCAAWNRASELNQSC
jgi:hypothetical protein